jgi:hypothetical protein
LFSEFSKKNLLNSESDISSYKTVAEPTALVSATFKREKDGMTLKITTPEVADTRPYHGVKIRFVVLDQNAPPPTNPEQLTTDDFITAKKKIYTFDADQFGKFLYYSHSTLK